MTHPTKAIYHSLLRDFARQGKVGRTVSGREKRGGRREGGGLERNGMEEDGGSFRVSALFPHLCGDASYFTWGSADEEDLDTSEPVIITLV